MGAHMICPPEHKHGATSTCYTVHKCRCDECTSSRTGYQKMWKEARAGSIPNHAHGMSPGGYPNGYFNYNCRCTDCKGAWAEYARERRRKV
jgi:hypothetical protein